MPRWPDSPLRCSWWVAANVSRGGFCGDVFRLAECGPDDGGVIASAPEGFGAMLALRGRTRSEGFGILDKTNEHGRESPR